DEHRAGVGATGVGPRPPLNPQRLAIVLPAQLKYHSAGIDALTDGSERLFQAALGIGRIRDERGAVRALDLIWRNTQTLHCCLVSANKLGLQSFVDMGDRPLVK